MSQTVDILDIHFVQKVCVFGTMSKLFKPYHLLFSIRSYATFCVLRQNPVCGKFWIHRRNRHEGFKQ